MPSLTTQYDLLQSLHPKHDGVRHYSTPPSNGFCAASTKFGSPFLTFGNDTFRSLLIWETEHTGI